MAAHKRYPAHYPYSPDGMGTGNKRLGSPDDVVALRYYGKDMKYKAQRWMFNLFKSNDRIICLDIPTRIANGLDKNGIHTIGQLLKWRNQYDFQNFHIAVCQLKGLGEGSARIIDAVLRKSFNEVYR